MALLVAAVLLTAAAGAVAASAAWIQPYPKNPYYWQYKGQPVLLLGGSAEDNFPTAGEVTLNVGEARGPLQVRWLSIEETRWQSEAAPVSPGVITLRTPGEGSWIAVVAQAQTPAPTAQVGPSTLLRVQRLGAAGRPYRLP